MSTATVPTPPPDPADDERVAGADHDHRCPPACMASEEHMLAMEADADRQLAELDAYDDDEAGR